MDKILRMRLLCFVAVVASACGGGQKATKTAQHPTTGVRADGPRKEDEPESIVLGSATKEGFCQAPSDQFQVAQYDTNGDDKPDVRKVYHRIGEGAAKHLVLHCREVDLNGDGTKDAVRWYDNDGKPVKEQADRDFDGKIDVVSYFDKGWIVRQETDNNRDGKVDLRVFYDNGKPVRTEKDITARSSTDRWKPDSWEYFENNALMRTGTDLDGDGSIDRWDRDVKFRNPDQAEGEAEANNNPSPENKQENKDDKAASGAKAGAANTGNAAAAPAQGGGEAAKAEGSNKDSKKSTDENADQKPAKGKKKKK